MATFKINDQDREDFINNIPELYHWWLLSRKGITIFVRENRAKIT